MKRSFYLGLVLCLLLSGFALAYEDARFDRGLGETLHHLVAAGGESMVITAYNKEIAREAIAGYEQELQVLTPAFGKAPRVITAGDWLLAAYVLVENNKVVKIEAINLSAPAVPAIPANGMLVIAYGAAAEGFVNNLVKVGDSMSVKEVKAVSPKNLPEYVVAPNGDFIQISGWNRGRRADELIIFTPDYGSHTFTNQWGIEIAVENDEVIFIRQSGAAEMLEIPADGYVISGHGAMISRLSGIRPWDIVELE